MLCARPTYRKVRGESGTRPPASSPVTVFEFLATVARARLVSPYFPAGGRHHFAPMMSGQFLKLRVVPPLILGEDHCVHQPIARSDAAQSQPYIRLRLV